MSYDKDRTGMSDPPETFEPRILNKPGFLKKTLSVKFFRA